MAKFLKNAEDIIIPIVFSLAIIISIGVHVGIKYGSKAALVYALIFSVITGFLILLSFLMHKAGDFIAREELTEEKMAECLRREREERGTNWYFIVGTIIFLVTVVGFTGGVWCGISVGVTLTIMVLTAYFLKFLTYIP